MIQISVIGSGNVAHHLIQAFSKTAEIELVQVVARKAASVADVMTSDKIITDIRELKPVDLVIIAVTDDAIAEVSRQIPFLNQLVVHTSGTKPITILDNKNRKGVFYPLQTFSKSAAINFKSVPLCLEAQNDNDFHILETVAKSISDSVYKISSEQRKALHVAAVFVCNFVNHLYQIGNDICNENQLDFDILKPLIQETAQKIMTLSPTEAQTGPARRGDSETINTHLSFLTNDNQKEIYKLLTKSILENGKKL